MRGQSHAGSKSVAPGAGAAEQHRHEDADRERAPIRDVRADVPEEQHQQPRRGKRRDEEDDDADDQESHTGPPSGMTTLTGEGDRAAVQSCTTDVRSNRSCAAALRVLTPAQARLSTPNVTQISARPVARTRPTRAPV